MPEPLTEYANFLSKTPAHWSRLKMRDVGTVVSGGTPSRDAPSLWNGGIPWVTPGELTSLTTKEISETNETISNAGLAGSGANLLPPNSLLITSRATLGARALNTVPMATNQGFKSVIPFNSRNVNFLYHLVEKLKPELIRRASGTTFLEISGSEFGDIDLSLPDADEATIIAEVLDTLDAAIRGTEAVVARLKAMKQGLLHDLLTRGIDANGDLRPPHTEAPHLYKETPLSWLPKEWTCDRFVSKVDFPQGQVSPLKAPYRDWVLIAPDHIESETGRLLARQTATEQAAISGKYTLEPGDIVYSKIRPYLRKAILSDQQALCSADMYPLRPKQGVDARFLLGLILGESFSRFTEAVSMRSGFPKINRSELGEYWCYWPNYEEQLAISERLAAADVKEEFERLTLSKLKSQKSGLMDDLLTGRVPVTPLLEGEAAHGA